MNGTEREELKESAWGLIKGAETPEARAEGYLMLIEAHFHRNPKAPNFPVYASHWLAASEGEIDVETFSLLKARFSAPHGRRMIADGYSDWGSYGNPGYKTF